MKVPTDEFALRYTPFIGNVCNYLRAICYEQFVWIFPIISPFLFSSIPFIMHSTNNTLNHQQLGASVDGQECTGERGPDGRGLTVRRTVPTPTRPHSGTVDWSADPPKAVSRGSQNSIFLGVPSCHLTLWGTAGGS